MLQDGHNIGYIYSPLVGCLKCQVLLIKAHVWNKHHPFHTNEQYYMKSLKPRSTIQLYICQNKQNINPMTTNFPGRDATDKSIYKTDRPEMRTSLHWCVYVSKYI